MNSHVLREFPRKLESSNLCRDNVSTEIGRNFSDTSSWTFLRPQGSTGHVFSFVFVPKVAGRSRRSAQGTGLFAANKYRKHYGHLLKAPRELQTNKCEGSGWRGKLRVFWSAQGPGLFAAISLHIHIYIYIMFMCVHIYIYIYIYISISLSLYIYIYICLCVCSRSRPFCSENRRPAAKVITWHNNDNNHNDNDDNDDNTNSNDTHDTNNNDDNIIVLVILLILMIMIITITNILIIIIIILMITINYYY